MESLTGIVAFVRAAEALSFVGAGRLLGISASAVGKNVSALERSLGVRLLHRSTRRVNLTAEGRLFYDRCRRILEDLNDAEAMISQSASTPRGRLKVSLPTAGHRFLVPVLPQFCQLYPEIELDLDFTDRLVDLIDEGVDVAIRSGTLPDTRLMSRKLGPFRFLLCASGAYLARRGIPQKPKDLEAHSCLRFRFPGGEALQDWSLSTTGDVAVAKTPQSASFTNLEAIRLAAVLGLGIAHLPDFVARDAIADGLLQSLLDEYLLEPAYFSAVWPSSRQLSPKIRVFVDFAAAHLFTS
nr:LysR family transcriptional regulator [Bradyrhizobium japonicum]